MKNIEQNSVNENHITPSKKDSDDTWISSIILGIVFIIITASVIIILNTPYTPLNESRRENLNALDWSGMW